MAATAGPEVVVAGAVYCGRILKATTTTLYLPFEDEKLPDKNDFPRVIEVKPSNRIKKHKVKKGLKFDFILISDSCTFIHGT